MQLVIFSNASLQCIALLIVHAPHGMAVTGTDCTQMPGIGRTFSGYSSMITSSIRVACLNCQFRGTQKFLRIHQVFEETLVVISKAFFLFLLHNHFINKKNNFLFPAM
jgi:hypothetical protein